MTSMYEGDVTFTFKLSSTGESGSYGEPATVTIRLTNLPSPDENIEVANFEIVQIRLSGTDPDTNDSIVAARITGLPDSSIGVLYKTRVDNVLTDQISPNSIIEADENNNIYVYYESTANTGSTSFTFQIASRIDPNFNLNWSLESGTVTLNAYDPPTISVDPTFVEQNSTDKSPIDLLLVSDSIYLGNYVVTQLPSKGMLYKSAATNSAQITQNEELDLVDNKIYYVPNQDALEEDSFIISYQDEVTTSDDVTVGLLIGTAPNQPNSTHLSFTSTDTSGSSYSFTVTLNLEDINPFTDSSIEKWNVSTHMYIPGLSLQHGTLSLSYTSLDAQTFIIGDQTSLVNVPSEVQFTYMLDSTHIGRVEESFDFTLSFEFKHVDNSTIVHTLTGENTTFLITLNRPPPVSDMTRYISQNDTSSRIQIDLSSGDNNIDCFKVTALPDSTYGTLYTSATTSTPIIINDEIDGTLVYYEHTYDYNNPIQLEKDTFEFELKDADVWSIDKGTVTLSFIPIAEDKYISYSTEDSTTTRIRIELSDDSNAGFAIETLPDTASGILYIDESSDTQVQSNTFYNREPVVWFEPV